MKTSGIQGMQGLGAKSREMLERAGITTPEQLRQAGALHAFLAVKRTGLPVSLNLLWALEGALTGEHWQVVARERRVSLLLALEQAEREHAAAGNPHGPSAP